MTNDKKDRKRRRRRRRRHKPAPPEPSELDFELSDIWETGIPKDPEAAIAAFQKALEAGELDTEDSFEFLNQIRDALGGEDPQARARFGALVDRLRQQAPELHADMVPYFIDALLSDAIADNRWEAVPDLLDLFVEEPDRHADVFFNKVIDQLLYHGRIDVLRDTMRQAWPAIEDSGALVPGVADEFAGHAMMAELFAYLETADNPRADDAALLEATADYREWRSGWLENVIRRLTDPTPASWQRADFGEAVDADQWNENLQALLLDFVADRSRADVPLSRAYMAHDQLGEFLSWQSTNPTVSDDAGMLPQQERQRGKRARKRQRGQQSQISESPLVPRRALLDQFVAKKFHLFGSHPYKATALVGLLPAYLHFLARLNLIHPTEMDAALEQLSPIMNHLPRVLRGYSTDPVAIGDVTTAWAEETLAALQDDPALASARATPPPAPDEVSSGSRLDTAETYTFKVTYLAKSNVWRRIEIAGDQTLDNLHHAIQGAVNFDADHLYSFFMSGRAWDDATEYASPFSDGPSAANVKIRDLGLRPKQRFLYLFDYGDEHHFEVQLVDTSADRPKAKLPRVVERHGRNPQQYGAW